MRTRLLLLFALCFAMVKAQNTDIYYIYFSDGRVCGYPKEYVKELEHDDKGYTLTLRSDSVITWAAAEVNSISEEAPSYPQFTAFKLDDKLNDQLYRDVNATVSTDEVTATVSGIGKYLTPLFAMDMPEAKAYVGGKEQVSGQSRLRFADEVVYTLAYPEHTLFSIVKVSDEEWYYPMAEATEIPLTEDMLSTNAPTSREYESLGKMLDGDPGTIFHSTWSNDPLYSVDLSKKVYISIELEYPISALKFYYMGRTNSNTYNICEWIIEASNNGEEWNKIDVLDYTDGIPTQGAGVEYTSPAIPLGAPYRYLRFTASEVMYKNYLCLSEFRLYEVNGGEQEPELLKPAQYEYRMMPMGREVPVRIDWLTDHAESVPRIDIDIEGGAMVSSKEVYLDALITFRGNGVWDDYDFQDNVKIKGRGNTSWTGSPYGKNPYRLKFESSKQPFGMKKGKNWNLIAQRQYGSLMTNPVAHKIARMVGIQTANDVVPVELYMNGEYRGSYFFTQKVGMANNSVDYEDESMAALFELDTYSESGQFSSYSFGLPVNIKAPEFGEDETDLEYYGVKDEFNRFETAVYFNSNYERFVDIDMLVRYMLINDLVLNSELGHPKSTFLSRENMGNMTSRYIFGPAWDFDWAYGYEGSSSYCVNGATSDLFSYLQGRVGNRFYSSLLRSSDWVRYHYYRLWEEFIELHLDELIDFVDDYYAYANSSFVNNSYMWGDGYNYDTNVANMKSWLERRAHYIKNSLSPYPADAKEPFSYGDLNGDGDISETDVEDMLSCLFNEVGNATRQKQADADADGNITISDLTWINLLLSDRQGAKARERRTMSLWAEDDYEDMESTDFDLDMEDYAVLSPETAPSRAAMQTATSDAIAIKTNSLDEEWAIDVSLNNSNTYIAFMMDLVLPSGFIAANGSASIELAPRMEDSHQIVGRMLDGNIFRVVGYSASNETISGNEGELFTIALSLSQTLAKGTYPISIENVCFVTSNAYEYTLMNVESTISVASEKLLQTIPFVALPVKTYGDASFDLPKYTDAGLEVSYASNNVSVATINANKVTIVGAGEADITAQQMGNNNYYAAPAIVQTLVVDKAPLTIIADDMERDLGVETPYVLTYQGFVNGDTEKDLDELPQIICNADATSPAGTYPIRLIGGHDNNYDYALRDGVLTIVEGSGVGAPLTIPLWTANVYDIHGRLVRKNATSLDGLCKGVYIVNNQKIVIR